MTTTSIRGLDHAVILVRDLDRARDTYQRLGFTLTPRGTHSLGSQNHCIMFARDYLELLALSRPVADLGDARFTLVQLPPTATPGFRTFVCQHHTREIVWRPEYQRHANGAQGIASVAIAAPDASPYSGILGALSVTYVKAKVPSVTAIHLAVGAGEAHGIVLEFS